MEHAAIHPLPFVPVTFHMRGMAKKLPNRFLPVEAHYAGTVREAGAELRFWCPRCRQLFLVGLTTILRVKGPRYVLLDRRPRCRVAKCGGRGFYLYVASPVSPMVPIVADMTGLWLMGPVAADFAPSPPDDGPEGGGPDGGGPEGPDGGRQDDRPRWLGARNVVRTVG